MTKHYHQSAFDADKRAIRDREMRPFNFPENWYKDCIDGHGDPGRVIDWVEYSKPEDSDGIDR